MNNNELGPESVESQYNWSETPPSVAIIYAPAMLENVDPIQFSEEFDITLFNYIDPLSLETLVGNDQAVEITFIIDKYRVRINDNNLTVGYD